MSKDTTTGNSQSFPKDWNSTWDHLSAGAKVILQMASLLAPENVPIDFINKSEKLLCDAGALLEGENTVIDSINVAETLGELLNRSLIEKRDTCFTLHSIVRELARARIQKDKYSEWVKAVLDMVNDYFPEESSPDDVDGWHIWTSMQPHVSNIIHEADSVNIPEPTTRLMIDLGLYFESKTNYPEAERLYRRALQMDEALYGPDHPEVAINLNNLGELLRTTNRMKEAEQLYRRAIKIDEATYGPNHPEVANTHQ